MFCTRCGNPIEDGQPFCVKCGSAARRTEVAVDSDFKPEFTPPQREIPLTPLENKKSNTGLIVGIVAAIVVIGAIVGGILFLRNNGGIKGQKSGEKTETDTVAEETTVDENTIDVSNGKVTEENNSDVGEIVVYTPENESSTGADSYEAEPEEDDNDKPVVAEADQDEFFLYASTIEDYDNALDPSEYEYYDSGIDDFNFYYSPDIYNYASKTEKNVDTDYGLELQDVCFKGSNGSVLEYTIYLRDDGMSYSEAISVLYNYEKYQYNDPSEILKKNYGDYGRVIITGRKNGYSTYDLITVTDKYLMKMIVTYPDNGIDLEQKTYVVECYYRMCGFSGSTKSYRSYRDYLNNY